MMNFAHNGKLRIPTLVRKRHATGMGCASQARVPATTVGLVGPAIFLLSAPSMYYLRCLRPAGMDAGMGVPDMGCAKPGCASATMDGQDLIALPNACVGTTAIPRAVGVWTAIVFAQTVLPGPLVQMQFARMGAGDMECAPRAHANARMVGEVLIVICPLNRTASLPGLFCTKRMLEDPQKEATPQFRTLKADG
mmetsp:Transcript_93140/g.267987  ORF Transcript_93140/g.267987 Transcript_93140/m.267987 type:complete len:194 (-) Transcript_93140:2980-3561(-)